jgi:hypothetical protein
MRERKGGEGRGRDRMMAERRKESEREEGRMR